MKRLSFCVLCAMALKAQSIAIVQPSSEATVSGINYQFQISLTSAPSVVAVCYTVDVYPAYNPGTDAFSTLGCSKGPSYQFAYNSYWNLNGPHQLVATAYDSFGNVVATSAAVPFNTANNWPVPSSPGMTVSTGTPVTSAWSGLVSVTPTITGSASTDNNTFVLWIDGIQQVSSGVTGASVVLSAYTTQFPNGTHNVCVTSADNTGGTNYTDGNYVGAATEWCRQVTFANGTTASATAVNYDKIYLAPGNTFTLTAQVLNADGSKSSTTPFFGSSNTSVATVGINSGAVTAVANGNAQIFAATPQITGTNNLTFNVCCGTSTIYTTSGAPFNGQLMTGWTMNVTGSGCANTGIYTLGNSSSTQVTVTPNLPTGSLSNCNFAAGPTRTVWAFVNSINTQPCFGGNGAVYSSYAASVSAGTPCIVMHELFSSFSLLGAGGDQPYNPGPLVDFNSNFAQWWTFELGAPWTGITGTEGSSGMAAWQANQTSYVASQEAIVSGYPNIKLYLTGDNFTRSDTSLWGSTNGPAGQWSTPVFQITMASWRAYSNVMGIAMEDEVNSSWSGAPLQGPITFSLSGGQTWLESIAASGGTCTATVFPALGYSLNGASRFIIHGSSVANMNNTTGNEYTATRSGNNFTFPCAGVANGNYNASNDPGLTLEPYGVSWYGSGTTCGGPGSACITSDAFANLRTQWANAAPSFGLAWPNAGLTGCASVANWGGNGTQSIGSVSQVGGYSDMYPANGTSTYLVQRLGANTIVTAGLNLGMTLRNMYGCYNPSLPITALTSGTVIGSGNSGYGIGQGVSVNVTSVSGSTITFSAPHGIRNVIPGMTRLYITGATNSGGAVDSTNNNFFITNCPTATTCNVILAAMDFSVTGSSGGLITYQDGSTKGLASAFSFNATGSNHCGGSASGLYGALCGDNLNYTGSYDSTQTRKRGQTFTVSGVSGTVTPTGVCLISGSCNLSRTFVLLQENLAAGATTTNQLWFREVPILAATGGVATIIQDNNYVKGRNGSASLNDLNPSWAFGEDIECIILRCAGARIYKAAPYTSGYGDQIGFGGQFAQIQIPVFADTTLSTGGQLFMNQHFENGDTVPVFHAHNSAALIWNRLAKYLLQPALNSPDYGVEIDCGSKAGTPGNVLVCLNASDGPQNEIFALSPYLSSGQQILRYVVNDHSIIMSILAAGTSSDTLMLQPLDAVFYVFPATFAAEALQPAFTARLADVPNATTIAVRYAYDPYYLDGPTTNVFNCGSGTCTPTWDRNIGTIYYRLIYLGASSQVLATSDVQTL